MTLPGAGAGAACPNKRQIAAEPNWIEQYSNYERDLQFSSRTMGSAAGSAAGHSIRIGNSSSRNNFLTYAECLTVVPSPPEASPQQPQQSQSQPLATEPSKQSKAKQIEQQNVGGMHFKAVKVQEPNIYAPFIVPVRPTDTLL